jgi:hypothetical protein
MDIPFKEIIAAVAWVYVAHLIFKPRFSPYRHPRR